MGIKKPAVSICTLPKLGLILALALAIACPLTNASPNQPTDKEIEALDKLVTTALDYAKTSIDIRRAAIDTARVQLSSYPGGLPKLRAEFAVADAYLNYQNGNLGAAIEAIGPGLDAISPTSHPNLFVRLQSLLGGLLITTGNSEEGLRTLEALFEQEFPDVKQMRIENARVNYASGLAQNGRFREASQAFEQALVYALSADEDLLALSAASNYLVLLRDQGMSAKAEYWLEQLRPVVKREPRTMATASLMLFDYTLMLGRNQTTEVIKKLEAFLAQTQPMPTLVRAHAEELYSEALLADARLPEALATAKRALAMLAPYPLEQPESIMLITRVLLAMNDYDSAEQQLKKLEHFEIVKPSSLAVLHRLRLHQALRANNNSEANDAFDDFMESNKAVIDFMNQQQTDYFEQKLDQKQTQRELERAREEQDRLTAEAAVQMAQANEARMRESSLRQQRGLVIGAVFLTAFIGVTLVYLNARRQLQSRLRQRLRQQNASLSKLVERKSEDLVKNVTTQAQLKEALAERRHMESIGQIAGHVAHDFNNVLQVISTANELLETSAEGAVEKSALEASSQSVRSASSRVAQLLAYSRNQQLEARVFAISDYLRDTSALFHSAVGDVNHLIIRNHCEDALVQIDGGQLTASIINLLRNAADAMAAPGDIVLRAVILPKGEHRLQLQVIDDGCGMNEKELEQAARPYYTTKEEGTGLGLSSVYGFALQSGGQVSIDSQVGVGTCVTLGFQLHEPVPGAEVLPEPAPTKPLMGSRVLIVEDNELVANTLVAILRREGAQTQWASSTDEAQSLLSQNNRFDLLLSDVKIPGPMDGFGLAKWVRRNFPDIRIGMMSGYGPSDDNDLNLPVLSKPFEINELLSFLAKSL